jgi:hypothetical protein
MDGGNANRILERHLNNLCGQVGTVGLEELKLEAQLGNMQEFRKDFRKMEEELINKCMEGKVAQTMIHK